MGPSAEKREDRRSTTVEAASTVPLYAAGRALRIPFLHFFFCQSLCSFSVSSLGQDFRLRREASWRLTASLASLASHAGPSWPWPSPSVLVAALRLGRCYRGFEHCAPNTAISAHNSVVKRAQQVGPEQHQVQGLKGWPSGQQCRLGHGHVGLRAGSSGWGLLAFLLGLARPFPSLLDRAVDVLNRPEREPHALLEVTLAS